MSWIEHLIMGFIDITMITLFIIAIVKDTKRTNRQVPNGKVFIREFNKSIQDILRAQDMDKLDERYVVKNDVTFKVKVLEETKQKGLEFETIPWYKSYLVYINGEPVCREHILHRFGKDNYSFEFSSTRQRDEVIDIIRATHKKAKEYLDWIRQQYNAQYDKKSFYTKKEK